MSKGKVLVIVLGSLMAIFLIYFLIDYGSSSDILKQYDGVKPDSSSGFTKTLQFLQSYTYTTKDATLAKAKGLTDDDIDDMLNGVVDPSSTGGQSEDPNPDGWLEEAKLVASTFKNSSGDFNYSQSDSNIPATINGKSIKTTRRDCSSFVSAMLYLHGDTDTYIPRSSNTFFANPMGWEEITGTFADVQPGDILCKKGHVAICVSNDGSKCYIADCGSTDRIKATANDGYGQIFDCTANISTWRSDTVKCFRHP